MCKKVLGFLKSFGVVVWVLLSWFFYSVEYLFLLVVRFFGYYFRKVFDFLKDLSHEFSMIVVYLVLFLFLLILGVFGFEKDDPI